MANTWDAYADYDSRATLAERLSAVRSFMAELRKAITADYQADGLSVRNSPLQSLLSEAKKDEEKYLRMSRRTRVVPIRDVNGGGC